jgi:hypothetical protein
MSRPVREPVIQAFFRYPPTILFAFHKSEKGGHGPFIANARESLRGA